MLRYGNQFHSTNVPAMRWRYIVFIREMVNESLPRYTKTHTAWLIPDGDRIAARVWVRVPIKRGLRRAFTVYDMDTRLWMDCGRGRGTAVTDLGVHSVHVKHMHPEEATQMRYTYTIVFTSQRTRGGFIHPENSYINRLVPGLANPWRGNVLIFRHGIQPGNPIVNITEGANELVEAILIHFFRHELLAHREDLGGHDD